MASVRSRQSTAAPISTPQQQSVRSRQSTAAPTSARSRQSTSTVASSSSVQQAIRPPYEPPLYALNEAAAAKIANLTLQSSTALHDSLNKNANRLIEVVGDINEDLYEREDALRKRKQQRTHNEAVDEELDREEEEELAELRDKTQKTTGKIESAVRKMIDGAVLVDSEKSALKEVQKKGNESVTAAKQMSSQAQSQSQRRRHAPDEDDEDDATPPNPTDITSATTQQPSASRADRPAPHALATEFETAFRNLSDSYTSRSLADRYSENNTYIQFQRTLHDAKSRDGAFDVPHASTWFPSDNASGPAPGVTATANAEDDSDDDIAISRTRISTRCPVTMLEFQDPLTSKKCPHSFERSAIIEMIHAQRPPTRGGRNPGPPPGWVPSVQCPVAGCEHNLSEADLWTDSVLARRIKRIQEARSRESQGGDGADSTSRGRRQAEEIESDDEDSDNGEDIDAVTQRSRSVKRERLRSTMGEDIEDEDEE